MVPNVKISSSTLSEGRTARLVCTPRILARASLEAGVTSIVGRIPEACSWRLTDFVGGYVTSDEEGPLQVLILLLIMMEIVAIGPKLFPLSIFPMMRIVVTSKGVRVHLAKVWAMMQRAGLLTRSLNYRLRIELKGESFLGGLLSRYSLCIMAERAQSTLATSTRECPFTLGIKP